MINLVIFNLRILKAIILRTRRYISFDNMKRLIELVDEFDKVVLQVIKVREGGENPKHEIEGFDQFILDNISSKDRVLDVGSGYGKLAFKISEKSEYVLGIDIREEPIVYSREKYIRSNLSFEVKDFFNFTAEDNFDVVVFSNVLEHIDDRKKFIVKALEIAPRLIIRVPAYNRSWMVGYKKKLNLNWKLHKDHFIEYTEETLHEEIIESENLVTKLHTSWGNIQCVASRTI